MSDELERSYKEQCEQTTRYYKRYAKRARREACIAFATAVLLLALFATMFYMIVLSATKS